MKKKKKKKKEVWDRGEHNGNGKMECTLTLHVEST